MERFLQAIVSGLTNGGVYALIALAFSIIYMTTRVINFAQGEVLMVGAYIYFYLASATGTGLPWPAALFIALIGAMLVGLVVHLIAIAPLGKFDPNTNIGWILTTLSLSLILVEVMRNVAGEQAKRIDPVIQTFVLVSALFALAAGNTRIYFVYLAYFPAVAFWALDAYYLRQERLFRKLYDHVRALPETSIDFSMNTSPFEKDVAIATRTTIKLLAPAGGDATVPVKQDVQIRVEVTGRVPRVNQPDALKLHYR